MNYTVIWTPRALRQLAAAWAAASDRGAVTWASDQIDRLLGRDPTRMGESRDPGRRILVFPPLVVAFEVIEDDKRVNVLGVRLRERPTAN